mgnify:CR=1 FL=1
MGAYAVPASLIGSSLLGGLFAPEGQELSSFEGIPGLDPRESLGEYKNLLNDYLQVALNEAGKPASVDTTVAPLPMIVGGGLPLTSISAPAHDPARRSPERRTLTAPDLSGVTGPSYVNAQAAGQLPGRRSRIIPRNPDQISPKPPPTGPGAPPPPDDGGAIPRPTSTVFDAPDIDEAVGGVELLLSQLRAPYRQGAA